MPNFGQPVLSRRPSMTASSQQIISVFHAAGIYLCKTVLRLSRTAAAPAKMVSEPSLKSLIPKLPLPSPRSSGKVPDLSGTPRLSGRGKEASGTTPKPSPKRKLSPGPMPPPTRLAVAPATLVSAKPSSDLLKALDDVDLSKGAAVGTNILLTWVMLPRLERGL